MSFSSDVKEELSARLDSARHCQIAEFAAIMGMSGRIRRSSGGEMQVELLTENEVARYKFIVLLETIFDIDSSDILYISESSRDTSIRICDQKQVAKILQTLKWADDTFEHIEPVFVDPDAECVKDMLCFFNLDAKVTQRKNNYIVYMKEGSNITDALNLMGAYVSQMELYNVMILKEMRNDVNRKVNCETANLNKTISAAVKQTRDIEYIRDTVGLSSLKEGLYQVAKIRLEHQDMNLKDIGELLDPPVGKSGVNHRLRKISEMADEIRAARQGY